MATSCRENILICGYIRSDCGVRVIGDHEFKLILLILRFCSSKQDRVTECTGIADLSSEQKLILVQGFVTLNLQCIGCQSMAFDVVELIYYFYDTKLQRSYLSPYFYRIFYVSRPFGLAICERLNGRYFCLAMPSSSGGKLGIRAGSQVLAYNHYVFDAADIHTLHEHFPETKSMSFDVCLHMNSVLNSDACLPLTLYLKYDCIELLEKMDESAENYQHDHEMQRTIKCNFFDDLHVDTIRWAIHGKVQPYRVVDINGCDVMSSLPAQSQLIQTNMMQAMTEKQSAEELALDLSRWNAIYDQCVVSDAHYYRVGHVNYDDVIKCYGKAGNFIYCVYPVVGWIEHQSVKTGHDRIVPCENVDENDDNDDDDDEEVDDDATMSADCKWHFEVFITAKYIREAALHENLAFEKLFDENSDDDIDARLMRIPMMQILTAVQSKKIGACFKLIYFMGSAATYSRHRKQKQQQNIKKLINLATHYKQCMELILVKVQNNVTGDYNARQPIFVNGRELSGYVVGRMQYGCFESFGMQRQVTSFQFGILLIGPHNEILIRPTEQLNEAMFRKIKYLLQGRRMSMIGNLSQLNSTQSFVRTLSIESV